MPALATRLCARQDLVWGCRLGAACSRPTSVVNKKIRFLKKKPLQPAWSRVGGTSSVSPMDCSDGTEAVPPKNESLLAIYLNPSWKLAPRGKENSTGNANGSVPARLGRCESSTCDVLRADRCIVGGVLPGGAILLVELLNQTAPAVSLIQQKLFRKSIFCAHHLPGAIVDL